MNEKLRLSGIDFIGDVPWGTHFCQFYQRKEDLTDILVPYFKAGLENNEFCTWVTSSPLEVEEAKEAMKRAVPDIDVYLEKGQIEIIPYIYWYVKEGVYNSERILNGWVEKLNQALESGYEGLRLAGNTSWLEKENRGDFVEYEKKMNAVISSCHMIALCTYSLDVHDVTEAIGIAANHQFTLAKKGGKWEKIESSSRQNITEPKRAEEALSQSEHHIRLKPESTFSPEEEIGNLELGDIIDAQAIQSLMDDFYTLANIPVGIIDIKGNVLVGVGWQDICTKFHRSHPEACKHCVESDTKLSVGVLPGKFKPYKCKNNMWDIATPIIVGGQHVGNIFLGQFFFDGEPLDYELFRYQARKYGFNEEEYIAALEKVPRLSTEVVDTIMAFFMKLANMLSQLGYSNVKLAQSLAERNTLVEALRESEKRERAHSDELAVVLDAVPAAVWVAHDPQALKVTGNRLSYEWIRIPEGANSSKSAPEGERPETFRVFKDGVEIPPADMPVQMSAAGIEINDYEFDLIYPDGVVRHILGNARPLRDEQGNPRGSVSAFIDITERKKTEEALKKAHENLEEKVKERTTQLENAYRSLKESEKGLAEAQRMAHIGSWDWDLVTGEAYWSDEMYRIYGRNPQESGATYDELLNYIHPEDRDYVNNAVIEGLSGKPQGIDYRIILANGEERTVHAQSEIIFDEKNIPIRVKGITQDITEGKKSEEKLRESEEKYRNIVETANEGIFIIDAETTVTYANKKMTDMLGYTLEEVIGRAIWDFISEEVKAIFKLMLETRRQGLNESYELKLICKDGSSSWVLVNSKSFFDKDGKFMGAMSMLTDITKRKEAEEALENIEIVRKKEIHHRIKNNLQVISSLLDLQAEKFNSREDIKDSEVLEAIRESQDRIISIALIHEELHEGGVAGKLNFSSYLKRLVENLFKTYRLGNVDLNLSMDLEENIFFDMDTAVPLGIIVNEIVSNSLKYAFPDGDKGEIQIKLFKEEAGNELSNNEEEFTGKGAGYTLIVSDDGVGIPEKIDLENSDTLGLQLVNILVDQLDGEIKLKRDKGTEFDIRINV